MATETVQPRCQLPEDLVSILDGLGKAETVARQLAFVQEDSVEQMSEALRRLVT
jgi:hypothetical protein